MGTLHYMNVSAKVIIGYRSSVAWYYSSMYVDNNEVINHKPLGALGALCRQTDRASSAYYRTGENNA